MNPQQNDSYNFILDPASQPKSGPGFLQNPKQRNIIAAVFVLIVLLLVFGAFAIFQSLGKQSNTALIDTQAYQTEIVRLSQAGLKDAQDPNTKKILSSFNASVGSDLQATASYMAGIGVVPSEERLAQNKEKGIDKTLESARQRGNYDQAILEAIESASAGYKTALSSALEESSSKKRTEILNQAGANILILEKQSN